MSKPGHNTPVGDFTTLSVGQLCRIIRGCHIGMREASKDLVEFQDRQIRAVNELVTRSQLAVDAGGSGKGRRT